MRPEAQFLVHQYTRFRSNPKIPQDQTIKHVLKYLKGTAMQGLIMKPDTEEEN